jgi:hypothetical protein
MFPVTAEAIGVTVGAPAPMSSTTPELPFEFASHTFPEGSMVMIFTVRLKPCPFKTEA